MAESAPHHAYLTTSECRLLIAHSWDGCKPEHGV